LGALVVMAVALMAMFVAAAGGGMSAGGPADTDAFAAGIGLAVAVLPSA
jgi:hypothetical protein